MSASLRPMTVAEFIAWEDVQETKNEFDGRSIQLMTGGTANHATIQINIIIALGTRLRGTPCRVLGSELKIIVAGSVRYPDAFVTCSRGQGKATFANEPVVVFEISSPSSARIDHVDKLREYQLTQSIQRYIILEQDLAGGTVFTREGSELVGRLRNAADIIEMPEIGISVPMSEFYLDVDLSA